MTARLIWNGKLYPRVDIRDLPPPTLGERWIVENGFWKLQSVGPSWRGPATRPIGDPHHPPRMNGRMQVGATVDGAVAPVPSPGGGAPGTLAPSGFPASSAPPVPAGAMGLTDAPVHRGGISISSTSFGGYPYGFGYYGYPGYYYGYPYYWPWIRYGWAPHRVPAPPAPDELYELPISGTDRRLYCRRIYQRYCRRYPRSRYCRRWRSFCRPFVPRTT